MTVESDIAELRLDIKALRAETHAGFVALARSLDTAKMWAAGLWCTAVIALFGAIIQSNAALNTRMDGLQSEITANAVQIQVVATKVDGLTKRVDELASQMQVMTAQIQALTLQVQQIASQVQVMAPQLQKLSERMERNDRKASALAQPAPTPQ